MLTLLRDVQDENRFKSLKIAVESQNNLMDAARNGKGIDRHLFGLWCAAYEADLPVPELYEDELYKKRYISDGFIGF